MAPLTAGLDGWLAAGEPGLALLSLLVLFILTITFLALCSRCKRHSFELQESAMGERTPSILIRVVKLEEAMGARANPTMNDITKDEKDLNAISEHEALGLSTQPEGNTAWRNHTATLNQDKSPLSLVEQGQDKKHLRSSSPVMTHISNGNPGAVTVRSSSPQISIDDIGDRSDITALEFHSTPTVIPVMKVESSLQSASPIISGHIEDSLIQSEPRIHLEEIGSLPMPIEDQTGEAHSDQLEQHVYETIGEMKHPVPELSHSTEDELEDQAYPAEKQLDPYATFRPNISLSQPGEEPELLALPTWEAEIEESCGGKGVKVTYARLSKKIRMCPTPPPVAPPDDEEDDLAPPLPERSSEESSSPTEP